MCFRQQLWWLKFWHFASFRPATAWPKPRRHPIRGPGRQSHIEESFSNKNSFTNWDTVPQRYAFQVCWFQHLYTNLDIRFRIYHIYCLAVWGQAALTSSDKCILHYVKCVIIWPKNMLYGLAVLVNRLYKKTQGRYKQIKYRIYSTIPRREG